MPLYVAIMGADPAVEGRGHASWGSWDLASWQDPAGLARAPQVLAADTTHVLVLAPAAGAAPTRAAAAAIAASRPDLPVSVELPDVSLAVLVRAMEALPTDLHTPAAVHRAVMSTLAATRWGAWLPTVAKLNRPSPSLRQHARSWRRNGPGFLAMHGSPGWVQTLPMSEDAPERDLPDDGSGSVEARVCHVFGEMPEPVIATLLAMGLRTRPRSRLPLGDADDVWGTPRAAEFVITPGAPVSLGDPAGECPACAQPIWQAHCPYCGVSDYRSAPSAPEQGAAT